MTHAEFARFVAATGYVTDAERYGWSVVQRNVYDFEVVEGATWRRPDGRRGPPSDELPVTQVSLNDAEAYCAWAGARLPSYDEYWRLVAGDERPIVVEHARPISEARAVNVVGNVWEITTGTVHPDSVRLAGGSVFCSPATCDGTAPARELYVDRETANVHIGFAVVDRER